MTFPTLEQVRSKVVLDTGNPGALSAIEPYHWDQAIDYLETQNTFGHAMNRGIMPRMETPDDFLKHPCMFAEIVIACIEKVIKPSEKILLDALTEAQHADSGVAGIVRPCRN